MKRSLYYALMLILMLSLALSMSSCYVFHEALNHELEVTVDPTCTENGRIYCAICGFHLGEIPVLGHVVADGVCCCCGEIFDWYEAHSCYYIAEVTDPTCTQDGFTVYTCVECDNEYTEIYTDKIPHNYVDGVCEDCGDILHAHSYTARVFEPTCAKQGYTEYTCECNDKYIDNYTDTLPHEYIDEYCKNCGIHDHNYETTEVISDPTCSKAGTAKCICSCGKWIEEAIPTISHIFVNGRCTVCYEYAHTHSYVAVVISPNCIRGGYTEYTCECGDRYEDANTDIDPEGHKYVNGKCVYCYEAE